METATNIETPVPVELAETPPQPAVVPAAPVTPPPQSPQVTAALRQLMDRDQQLAQREKALGESASAAQRLQELENSLSDPSQALQLLSQRGHSYDDLTNVVLQNGRPDPTAAVRSEVNELRQLMETQQRQQQERSREMALSEAKTVVESFVTQNESHYPLTVAAGMQSAVSQTVMNYMQSGQNISEAEAAAIVEGQLSDLSKALFGNESIRSRFTAPPEATPDAGALLSNLTNQSTISTTAASEVGSRTVLGDMDPEDALKAAAAMLRFDSDPQ